VRFLAQPDVGFATGTGTEVAIEASDVTLIKGSVMCIITAIENQPRDDARQCAMCARTWSARVATTRLAFRCAMGVLYPFIRYLDVAAHRRCGMAFSSVTVVTNANRLRFVQPKRM
jgi:Cu+-exporting ATPase